MTYAQWSSELIQWALGIPWDMFPGHDTTGEFADVDQSGAVWFLALNLDGGTVTRTMTVPNDKFLFFPIISWFATFTGWPGEAEDLTLKRQRSWIESSTDTAISDGTFWCKIDGVAVSDLESYRTITAPGEEYFVTTPDDGFFPAVGAGTYGPSLNGGIYLLLRPLSPGEHTIEIFVTDYAGYTSDLTYELTVE